MNSINWPALGVWVFIAQLVEHCSANAEATGSNPVEGPTNFFFGLLRNCLKGVNCDPIMSSKQKKYKSNYVVSSPFDLKFILSYNTPTLM